MSKFITILKEHPGGLTKEELIKELGISEQNLYNKLRDYAEYYILNVKDLKYTFKNPYSAIPGLMAKFGKCSLESILYDYAKAIISLKLATNGLDKKIEKYFSEYKTGGGL